MEVRAQEWPFCRGPRLPACRVAIRGDMSCLRGGLPVWGFLHFSAAAAAVTFAQSCPTAVTLRPNEPSSLLLIPHSSQGGEGSRPRTSFSLYQDLEGLSHPE